MTQQLALAVLVRPKTSQLGVAQCSDVVQGATDDEVLANVVGTTLKDVVCIVPDVQSSPVHGGACDVGVVESEEVDDGEVGLVGNETRPRNRDVLPSRSVPQEVVGERREGPGF